MFVLFFFLVYYLIILCNFCLIYVPIPLNNSRFNKYKFIYVKTVVVWCFVSTKKKKSLLLLFFFLSLLLHGRPIVLICHDVSPIIIFRIVIGKDESPGDKKNEKKSFFFLF